MPSARRRVSRWWPSTGTMRRSMIARSGRSSRSRRTASSALPVCRATLMPARASSSSDRPRRHRAWSSIRTTRMGLAHCGASSVGGCSGKRELEPRAGPAGAPQRSMVAAEAAGALAHDRDPVVARSRPWLGRPRRRRSRRRRPRRRAGSRRARGPATVAALARARAGRRWRAPPGRCGRPRSRVRAAGRGRERGCRTRARCRCGRRSARWSRAARAPAPADPSGCGSR